MPAFDPNDQTQINFLNTLALGESGGGEKSLYLGTGNVDLSNAPKDSSGFPIWSGTGNSHAAGIFQFQPGTWKRFGAALGLNFGSATDQENAAWQDAQATYARNTGGDLETALKAGQYSTVQHALENEWTSLKGSTTSPSSFTQHLANNVGAILPNTATSSGGDATGSTSTGLITDIENWFLRGGLILVGGIIVIVALWFLLAKQDIVPSPAAVGRAVATA